MKITLTCDKKHLDALRAACEFYTRVSLGQFGEVAGLHEERLEFRQSAYEAVDRACKDILMPGYALGGGYGITNKNVNERARLCYELFRVLDGGKPLSVSGVDLPVMEQEGVSDEDAIREA